MARDDIMLTSASPTQIADPKKAINTSSPSPEESDIPATVVSSPQELQEQLQEALREEEWDLVESLCECHPSLARQSISMVCQGENSTCLPIHFCAGQKSTPVSTIDVLVTAHPSSLLAVESSGLRLALHLAVLKGASFAVVRYLCEALPQSMSLKDQEGNLPLHYAAMYSNDAIVALLAKAHPEACAQTNQSDRLPLHLLCARCWDKDAISVETIRMVLEQHPQGLQAVDRSGRLPLHVCCSSQSPRGDVLKILMEGYPEGLLVTDKSKATPYDLARQLSTGPTVVMQTLQEGTNRERRKKYKFLAPFKSVGNKIARRRHSKANDVDALHLHYCYG